MDNGFSLASVILSYFLVGGGMFTATLIAGQLHLANPLAGYVALAAGAFVGGFVAARASRGRTVLEPALGAVAVVATTVALAGTTPVGKLIWAIAQDQTLRFVAELGVTGLVGALIGALLGEKLFGEATRSAIPWLLYAALSVFGACLLATLFASLLVLGHGEPGGAGQLGQAILIGIAAGCLLAGLAIGASARVRPLIASLVGSAGGVMGFFTLVTRASPADQDTTAGLALLAAGGAVLTLIGTAVGWIAFGRRGAG